MKVSRYIRGSLTFAGAKGFEALANIGVDRAKSMGMARDAGVNALDTANLFGI